MQVSSLTNSSRVVQSRLPCPSCTSSDAYHVYDDGHGYCFSCQYYNPSKSQHNATTEYTYQFVPWRGISEGTLRTFDAKSKIDPEGKPISIAFRYPNGDYKVRSLDKKEFFWSKVGSNEPTGLFGQDKFTPGVHKYITVTEGELDALTIHQVLGGPAVSVSSASSAVSDCTRARSWLNAYDRIYLAFDNDPVGREATAAVARLFDRDKVFHVKFGHRKDANEYLLASEEQKLKSIWWGAKKYLPENIISSLDEFKTMLSTPPKLGAPYPFAKLTAMTYGIRTGETVLITAQEKVGKTEFMHTILHNLLKEQADDVNIGALFFEEPGTRTLQAIAGIELGKPIHLPDCIVSEVERNEALDKVVKRDDRLYLHPYSGGIDPDAILDTLRFLAAGCACRFILWDHPGMVVFGASDDKERQTIDYLATRTELLAQELDFALLVVYHVNDQGQIRGSRYPGKTCSVRINLSRDMENVDPDIRNQVHISVGYNRFCSASGPVGTYTFDEQTQKYTEAANNNEQSTIFNQAA